MATDKAPESLTLLLVLVRVDCHIQIGDEGGNQRLPNTQIGRPAASRCEGQAGPRVYSPSRISRTNFNCPAPHAVARLLPLLSFIVCDGRRLGPGKSPSPPD
jgi:hypothetical protein